MIRIESVTTASTDVPKAKETSYKSRESDVPDFSEGLMTNEAIKELHLDDIIANMSYMLNNKERIVHNLQTYAHEQDHYEDRKCTNIEVCQTCEENKSDGQIIKILITVNEGIQENRSEFSIQKDRSERNDDMVIQH